MRSLTRPLMVVAIMLVGSAAIRFSEGIGPVMADATRGAMDSGAAAIRAATEPELDLLQKSLLSREADLVAQAEIVAAREAAAQAAEEEIARRQAELDAAENELAHAEADLERRVRTAKTANETDIAKLVAVYEAMKPQDAAEVFEAMSPEFASGFLSEMSPNTAAMILADLSPEFAYSVSVLMAGRNAGMDESN
ncbi:MotE family protein [Dinoroseobacter shibae]|jgi:flagellar motility protein MotE (MotC chaperone)